MVVNDAADEGAFRSFKRPETFADDVLVTAN
jgi:hypothetical protein